MHRIFHTRSLRRRLIWAVLAATAMVFAALGFSIQSAIERSSSLEFDERLAQQGRVILAYAEHEYGETGSVVPEQAPAPDENHPTDVVYQVWTLKGTPVHRSRGAPLDPLVNLAKSGFGDVRIGATDWRVYVLHSANQALVVQMAELRSHRNLIAARVRSAVLTPTLLSLPLLALLVWWLTTAALRPIDRLVREIRGRTTADMEPLDMSQVPEEVNALGLALNTLIARQADALVREQRFTADAAHELRTPLAAVRAQAQVALRSEKSAEREHALRQLIAGVDRSTRLVTQLLSLARLEPAVGGAATTNRSIASVLHDVLHDLEPDIERHNVRIEVIGTPPDTKLAEEPAYLLLRNILDNAVHHSPMGGIVRVETGERNGRLAITVSDQGPGISPESRSEVFDRFRRLSNSYAGSGLGLFIVKRVVDLLGGRIELADADPAPGLLVTIDLPIGASAT